MDNKHVSKTIRRRRSECSWKKTSFSSNSSPTLPSSIRQQHQYDDTNLIVVDIPPSGPIRIVPSWNPINRSDKPPYSYATMIGHAILTSKERRLTLNEIYVWITENYPFYSNETQGWQNSIRHNLSLHKAFVKMDRDNTQNPPRKGCFWTIRVGKEKSFIDNLQKPIGSTAIRKQYSCSKRQQNQLRRSSLLDMATNIHHNTTQGERGGRTTHTITVPESEQQLSSDQYHYYNQSPTITESSSNTSPHVYQHHELLVPDTATTYQVYPDDQQQHEIFGSGSNCSVTDTYSTGAASTSYPPSSYAGGGSIYVNNKNNNSILYNKAAYSYNNMLDWHTVAGSSGGGQVIPPLKQQQQLDHLVYATTNTLPSYYYLQQPHHHYQQQQRLHNNHGDFSSFLR